MPYMKIVPYVIHEHDAIRAGHHFDFRIKYPNKNLAASWAIKKGFPRQVGEKVFAVKVNDHGKYWLYAVDKMEIPKGEYGAGTITVYQKGKAEVYGWGDDFITFYISGPNISGRFALKRINIKEKNTDGWILIKTKVQNDT